VPVRRALAAIIALAIVAPHAHAKGKKQADDEEEASSDDEEEETPKPKKKKKKDDDKKKADDDTKPTEKKKSDDEVVTSDDDAPTTNRLAEKQDLTGHDLGTAKKNNAFEKDRFFVDKSDTEKTAKGTLVQGSLTSSSFLYTETGGSYGQAGGQDLGQNAAPAGFSRVYTDLRLQTDFRHIAGSRWEARFDGRVRFVSSPPATSENGETASTITNHVQSGLTGENEYEIREAWIVRNGDRSDVFIGRQFIPDLGALKIDGIRIDYASSKKFTLIGFGGLYPFRGSRSITTDYIDLKTDAGMSAGKFVAAGGFGAAYRTDAAYGSFGGVALDPLQPGEAPRVYGTATGYTRFGSQLDVYHFALVDLFGSNAVNAGLTNVSGGLNYKPSQRLRLTASYNRVDTETLNVQANAFLTGVPGNNVIQNTLFVKRLATDAVRGSVSAGLGELQRFEITVATAYRYRPGFSLTSPDGTVTTALGAASGVDVYGSITDRRSFAHLRLGVDGSRSFAAGNIAYQRSEVLALRAFAGRELASGKGEWEAEISYASTKDTNGMSTQCMDLASCYGATNGTIISAGGTLFYRFRRDWFAIASAYLSDTSLTPAMAMKSDPAIVGLSGYLRIALRF
jgi:hypothetical protein